MITEYIVKNLKQNGVLEEKDETIVQYGLNGLLSTLFSIVTIILIGLYFNCLTESIIFTVTFFFLRIYAGGYHASTPLKCYGMSIVISIAIFYLIHNVKLEAWIITHIFIFSSIIVLLLSPVDTANKPLDKEEFKTYKLKTFKIIGIYILIYSISLIIGIHPYSWSICMATFSVTLLQILEIIKTNNIQGGNTSL